MTAYHPAALCTLPLGFFLFQKAPGAILLYEYKVVYHTHVVFGTVSFIEGFESNTGEIAALIAKSDKSFSQQITVTFHESTVLTARQTAGTVLPAESLFVQIILHSKIISTQSAIHPAGSDELFFHTRLSPH